VVFCQVALRLPDLRVFDLREVAGPGWAR